MGPSRWSRESKSLRARGVRRVGGAAVECLPDFRWWRFRRGGEAGLADLGCGASLGEVRRSGSPGDLRPLSQTQPVNEWETIARSALREGTLEFPARGCRRVPAELKRRDLACHRTRRDLLFT